MYKLTFYDDPVTLLEQSDEQKRCFIYPYSARSDEIKFDCVQYLHL